MLRCPYCGEDSGHQESADLIGEKVECNACGKTCEVEYEETSDGEDRWWTLVKAE